MNLTKGDQNTVAAESLSRLTYHGQSSAEAAYAVALVPPQLEQVVFDNLTYLDLRPKDDASRNDYQLSDGVLILESSGIGKLIEAGVTAPVFEAMQGRKLRHLAK